MHFGPSEVLLALDAQFNRGTSEHDIQQAVIRIQKRIRERFPEVRRIYIETRRVGGGA